MNLEVAKKLIGKELQKYKNDKTCFKSYTDCIRELNAWLKEMKK